jgi:hypothetical protein
MDQEILKLADEIEEKRIKNLGGRKITGPVKKTVDLLLDSGYSAKTIIEVVRQKHEISLSAAAISQYRKKKEGKGKTGGAENESVR